MIVLAVDTSNELCAACVFDSDAANTLSAVSCEIGRGHAEILMDQIKASLDEAGLTLNEIDRVSAACGPGSFTGIRVGLAAAKGIGQGLGIPALGISCLDACEALAVEKGADGPILSVLDAKRGQYYCKLSTDVTPWLDTEEGLSEHFPDGPFFLAGSGALAISRSMDDARPIIHENHSAPIVTYAKIAATIKDEAISSDPIYLRTADAKVQTGFALQREKNQTGL